MLKDVREQFNQEFEQLKETNGRLQVLTATAKVLDKLNVPYQSNPDQTQIIIPANAILNSQLFIRPRPFSLTITGVTCINPSHDLLAELLWTWHKHPREAVYFAPFQNAEYNTLDLAKPEKEDKTSGNSGQVNVVLDELPSQPRILVCNLLTINLRIPLAEGSLKHRVLGPLLDEGFDQIQEASQRLLSGDYGRGGLEITEEQLNLPKQIDLHLV